MDELELRKKIYEILGLEFGSLSNEGGNDWIRAKNEALEEYKKQEFEKLDKLKKIDYLTIEKDSEEFKSVMQSKSLTLQNFQILISKREDLTNEDIDFLINVGNKDILINLAKYQKLSSSNIDYIVEEGVFLAKKNLIENQELSDNHKQKLLEKMNLQKNLYNDLIDKIN
jgi:hypothetical protein